MKPKLAIISCGDYYIMYRDTDTSIYISDKDIAEKLNLDLESFRQVLYPTYHLIQYILMTL